MSRRGRKRKEEPQTVATLPDTNAWELPPPPPEPVPPLKLPWSVNHQYGYYFLVRNGAAPFNRAGMAALSFDDEQAALDLCEALNEAYRRRSK